jgi:hypothetical protein
MIGGTIAELAETDAAGAVEMPLLNGVEYSLGARAWTSYREVHGNRIGENWVDTEEKIFPRNSSLPEVILVLNRPRPKR